MNSSSVSCRSDGVHAHRPILAPSIGSPESTMHAELHRFLSRFIGAGSYWH